MAAARCWRPSAALVLLHVITLGSCAPAVTAPLCGGACADSMVLDRRNASIWGLDAEAGAYVIVSLTVSGSQQQNFSCTVGPDGFFLVQPFLAGLSGRWLQRP